MSDHFVIIVLPGIGIRTETVQFYLFKRIYSGSSNEGNSTWPSKIPQRQVESTRRDHCLIVNPWHHSRRNGVYAHSN